MRLFATGASVRAARSARLATSHRLTQSTFPSAVASCGVRYQRTQAAYQSTDAFPHQSVQQPRWETDPSKTARTREDVGAGERNDFRSKLGRGPRNTVLRDGDLTGANVAGNAFIFDSTTNLSPSILQLIDRKLYDISNHPLCITRKLIESVFSSPDYINHTVPDPVVTTKDNFDDLGFPADHPGRSRTDTYYVDSSHVLRTHTSAHQNQAFEKLKESKNHYGYTICADVYRRDSIDQSHFPVFHQMEGARCWTRMRHVIARYEALVMRRNKIRRDIEKLPKHDLDVVENAPAFDLERNPPQPEHDEEEVTLMVDHLKKSLEVLVDRVFTAAKQAGVGGDELKDKPLQVRWVEAYFPFTSPSFELEVYWQGQWLELLGSGIVQQPILNHNGLTDQVGWAWGLGIERLAMVLFGIPDIRLFWSTDERFLSQFQEGKVTRFVPFSKYPACYKDVAFWIPSAPAGASPMQAQSDAGVAAAAGGDSTKASPSETQPAAFHENDVMELVRDVGGTLVEDVRLVDEFVHPKSGRKSLCYRINYRSLERTLTNEETNDLHAQVQRGLEERLGVTLR